MRFDTTNIKRDAKMYSIIGKASTGGEEQLVQVGMVGSIGDMIEDDIYEFLPPANGKDVFFLATPEVDADESDYTKNSLHGFTLRLGQVADAVQGMAHDKFTIEEKGIVGENIAVKKYVYVKEGERKLQYKETLPVEADKAVLIGQIESIVPATQTLFLKANSSGFQNLAMNYNLVKFRVLEKQQVVTSEV